MKLKMTIDQFFRVIKTEKPHYPITIVMKGIDKAKVEKLIKILKSKKN